MGRITLENASRYDDLGPQTHCFYCESAKVRGYDYIPSPSQLLPDERGTRVRACVNCLPKLHYHTVTKGRILSLTERQRILGNRNETKKSVRAGLGRFEMLDHYLVPSGMSSFLDVQGRPAQFFLETDTGPVDLISWAELEAAQLCIGATLLGVRCQKLDDAWLELQSTISPGAFEAIRKRLVESP